MGRLGILTTIFIITSLTLLSSCGSADIKSEKTFLDTQKQESDDTAMTRAELQEDLQRLSGVFLDRLDQSMYVAREEMPEHKEILLRQHLLYASSAVEIASGQNPEANLLDMLTFIHLSKNRIKKYWIPEAFGAAGESLLEGFEKSEAEVRVLANSVASEEVMQRFWKILGNWMEENDDLVLVERVRLTEVSAVEGAAAKARRREIEGILSSLKKAVVAADEGVLLANRAMYLSQRFSNLMRLQARLGSNQILNDSMGTITSVNEELAQMQQEVNPLAQTMVSLAKEAGKTVKDLEGLIKVFRESFPQKQEQLPQGEQATTMEKLNQIEGILEIVRDLNLKLQDNAKAAQGLIKGTREQLNSLVWTIALALLAAGGGLAAFWWGGYFLAKRGVRKT